MVLLGATHRKNVSPLHFLKAGKKSFNKSTAAVKKIVVATECRITSHNALK